MKKYIINYINKNDYRRNRIYAVDEMDNDVYTINKKYYQYEYEDSCDCNQTPPTPVEPKVEPKFEPPFAVVFPIPPLNLIVDVVETEKFLSDL